MRTTVRSKKENCTGCGACVSICPKGAIVMKPDEEGFIYPSVDGKLCISCGLCESLCPAGRGSDSHVPETYGAQNQDRKCRANSSSGGIFTALAEQFLLRDGVVFGSVFDEQMHVEHVGAITRSEVLPMRGSKYVQSNAVDALRNAAQLVHRGMPVLFSGTPCQVAGLYALLDGKRPSNLLTVDFVCHGVPSPGVFASYLKEIEQEAGGSVSDYSFRDKRLSWKNFSATAHFHNGKEISGTQLEDAFLIGFLHNLYLRPSCHVCHALRYGGHASDLTLADLWGAGEICPEKDDDSGLSLLFINTARGRTAFDACTGIDSFPVRDLTPMKRSNPSIFAPSTAHGARGKFFRIYKREGFHAQTVRKLVYPGRIVRLAERIKKLPFRMFRRFMGR